MDSFVFPLLCLCGLLFARSFAQDVDTGCGAYSKLAASTKTGPAQASHVITVMSTVGSIGPAGGRAIVHVETPSKTIWMPKCDQNSFYVPLQTRQNKEQFCVQPGSGDIVFDPSKNGTQPKSTALVSGIFCECNVNLNGFKSSRQRPVVGPVCDGTTGAYKSLQRYGDGACFCTSKDGKIRSVDVACDTKDPCTETGELNKH